ncbi:hypothetical protein FF38_05859 [Lucilia cuprina]|uniref:Uncharacterized protein n=1 Tax=Lucilia cuprina TaxID=7375 RepID=A0A0L0C228_LUCCU|nr:hypothetical protein FF38_05859 [Lucilia cuprina]
METIKYFGLENRNIKVISDGGSNIVAAMKIKNIERFNCMVHSLHRFISHDILNNTLFEDLNKIISKIKQIFRALTYRGEDILEIQQLKQNEKLFAMLKKIQNITNCIECDENIVFSDIESEIEAVLKNPHLPTLKKFCGIQNIKNCIECDENIVFSDIESEIEAVLKKSTFTNFKKFCGNKMELPSKYDKKLFPEL